MTKKEVLDAIIAEIFQLDSPKIEETRREQLLEFITSAVNGDTPITQLVINASVDEKNKGAIIYILTNLRLIKIDVAPKEIKSSSFPLNTLIGIDRKLIDSDQIEFSVSFQNGSFGLRYSQDLKNITDFFQKIELAGKS
jgi:hypothetical protein